MIIVGIVAGGTGSRMGNGDLPKQFMELGGKPVFIYTAEKFIKQSDFIIIGMNKEWLKMAEFLIEKFLPESKNIFVTGGGADRNGTVKNIIAFAREKLKCKDDDIILTHDAVRPFVDERMISESVSAIEKCDICTVAVPATDTIAVSADGEFAEDFPDRSKMFLVQTPQTFDIQLLKRAFRQPYSESFTDDASVVEAAGGRVVMVDGNRENIKLTTPFDLKLAESLINRAD